MDIKYITNDKALDSCVAVLSKATEIAVDLEFDKNRFQYGFQLCLMQIYCDQHCFLIDPLAENITISKVFPVLENPEIQKVTFAFGEDLRLLHSLKCFPKNVFDINIAASLLNYPPSSLTTLLKEVSDITSPPSQQNTNWTKRPLVEKQFDYAAQDVLHLLKLRNTLLKEAATKNVLEWIAEENEVFDDVDYSEINHNNFIKHKDKKGFTEQEWFVYTQLLEFREKLAEKYNKPNYQIMHPDYIRQITLLPEPYNIPKTSRLYKPLNNPAFYKQLKEQLEELKLKSRKRRLSATKSEIKRLGQSDGATARQDRRRKEEIKTNVFKPIQKLIAANYGENIVTYILGNRLIAELSSNNIENLRNYKTALFLKCAKQLKVNVRPFLKELKP